MCGIAGIVSTDPAHAIAMRRMLDALAHRGPDGEGIYHDGSVTHHPVATLGHRRLSIIDLAGGQQPLQNADRSIVLVCNGEIYNYRELRRELERDGHAFLTHSDCEVIIGLYERYGDRLLDRLRGMFAFVLWDVKRRRLLVARDHLGQKPLYYLHDERGFACASEIKALLAFDARAPRMNLAALDQYLALRLIDAPLSMFEGIHKLPPGHSLVLEAGGTPRIERYWRLEQEPKLTGSEDQLCDELEARIEEALRLHLVSDVPVGAFLSGGMDSSLLVAMLARKVGVRQLPTFTMGLDYQRFDEAPAARAVAQMLGTEHHEERVKPEITALLPDLVAALDEPSDPLSLCTWLLARFTRRHVKVVIGGDGGDELFGGYDRYYGNLYASHYGRVPETLRRRVLAPAVALIPESGWYKSVGHQLRWLHHLSFHSGGARYAASLSYFYFDRERRAGLFAPQVAEQWRGLDAEAAIRTPYETAPGNQPLDRMLFADSMVRLPNHPVMITDRICMAHGLEARSPFMDHELAAFAARLAPALKVRGGTLRYIQRKLAARYLPPHILNRPKQGFSSALPYLLQREYAQLYSTCLRDSRLARDRILDGAVMTRLIDEHLAKRADHGNRLWLLINAEVWYRMAILGESKEDMQRELTYQQPEKKAAGGRL
ncbi:MAG TPA: asparagine synthase (glutamine-hydrolyzing) [Steroidobacteraceae bacterium]|jgi:asparagine synthase (glutamine-hydrolysing)|nr:asparagine synthase (glutamine-hydrolyzing) [Steroidobacteraceae bacterium]